MTIYIDAMGGDHAPKEIIKGSVDAIKEYNVPLTLVGDKEIIQKELLDLNFDDSRISILHAPTVIGFDEEPVKAIRHKKDSSIVVALREIKKDPDSVLVSAGSTGALLAGGTLILGRIKGVKRPGLGIFVPQENKNAFLIDVGASSDAQPEYLLDYAQLAEIYLSATQNRTNLKVGLINLGAEEEKGSSLTKEAYTLLKNSSLQFIGNVEPNHLLTTEADIVVCDGFTGNVIIKTIEGLSKFLFSGIKRSMMSSLKGKLGGALIKNDLKKFKDDYDPDEHGGSPLLGVKGGVIKAHGSSNAYAFKNAIHLAILFAEKNVVRKLQEKFES